MLLCCHQEDCSMAITIRNKGLEAQIKAIGAKLNKGPTDVIKQLVAEHAATAAEREAAEWEALKARRLAAAKILMARASKATDEDRAAVRRAMEEMYDENGLPR
jgi:hypothetical protein